jgi:ribose 5-phosphate isomerase B
MKIAIGSDHAGFEMKEFLKKWLESEGYEVFDAGCDSEE